MPFKELFFFFQNLNGPSGAHREQSQIKKEADQTIARNLVFHHEKGFSWLQHADYVLKASILTRSLQLVEGMGAGYRVKNVTLEGKVGGISLNQGNRLSGCEFILGNR